MNLHHPFTSIYVHLLLNSTFIHLAPYKTALYQEIHLYNGVQRICIRVKFNIFKVKEDDNNHIKHFFNNGKIIHPPGSSKHIIHFHAHSLLKPTFIYLALYKLLYHEIHLCKGQK
jgi:hypothetical protein